MNYNKFVSSFKKTICVILVGAFWGLFAASVSDQYFINFAILYGICAGLIPTIITIWYLFLHMVEQFFEAVNIGLNGIDKK